MHPQISIKHNIGNVIEIPTEFDVKAFTYMASNVARGATEIPVDNAADFTNSSSVIMLLGEVGAENAEISYMSSRTDIEITANTPVGQPHNRGELVREINCDAIVISKSSTLNGTYTTLATVAINVTQQKTIYFDVTGLTTDYYKVEWRDTVNDRSSFKSDPVSVASYPVNSAGSIISAVLFAMGINENDSKITTPFLISAVNDAREYVKMQSYGTRNAWRANFEYPLRVLSGNNFVNLPDDIDFNETDRSLLAARFIQGNVLAPFNLKYIDKRNWNNMSFQISGGVTTEDALAGATFLTLNSVGDFPIVVPNGVMYIATTDFDQELLQVSYTMVDPITNEITGIAGIDRDIPAGTQVWITPTIGQPMFYTVYDDKIVFDRVLPDSMQGNNCYIDYYRKIDKVENLYQELEEPYREIYKWYLRYAIKYRKDITVSQSDPDYKKFEELMQAWFDNMYTGQDTIVITS